MLKSDPSVEKETLPTVEILLVPMKYRSMFTVNKGIVTISHSLPYTITPHASLWYPHPVWEVKA